MALGKELDVDVIAITEPNKKAVSKRGWHTDNRIDTAVYIQNRKLKITEVRKREGFIVLGFDSCALLCGYCSPNVTLEIFETFLEDMSDIIKNLSGDKIVLGDFNAKSQMWGSPTYDKRGEVLELWLTQMDLVVLNRGDEPTFQRGNSESYIDVSFATPRMATTIQKWEVLSEESLSDHRFIKITFETRVCKQEQKIQRGWKIAREEIAKFKLCINVLFRENQEVLSGAEGLQKVTEKACNKCFKRKSNRHNSKQPIYWWNEEIAGQRRICIGKRRALTRDRRRQNIRQEEKEQSHENYKKEKEILKLMIIKAKERCWRSLVENLNTNIWGDAYRIACGKIRALPGPNLTDDKIMEEAKKLFPQRPVTTWEQTIVDETPLLKAEELRTAGKKIKTGKAPGPDGIAPEVVKAVIEAEEEVCLKILNEMLLAGSFPMIWKTARLVLIEKARKNVNAEITYRPICLINCFGKLYEQLINKRLIEELESKQCLSDLQFGFRPGRSTVDALTRVQELADHVNRGAYGRREYCVLVTLDVRNAFNTVSWRAIVKSLKSRKISPYIIRVVKSYLQNRYLQMSDSKKLQITCGVPQGSVLGPTLWNVSYDSVLKLKVSRQVMLVAYADDLAILASGKTAEDIGRITGQAIEKIKDWMGIRGLELATEKSEAVVLVGRYRLKEITIKTENEEIRTTENIKYLGVVLDRNMNMTAHVAYLRAKTANIAKALNGIMPKIGGPSSGKRRMLAAVVSSVVLYGAPIWRRSLKHKKYLESILQIQRRTLLAVCRAYRTTSAEALQVIAGEAPMDLQVEKRTMIYEGQNRKDAENITIQRWQLRWEQNQQKGLWTKKLIPDLRAWVERKHGELTYQLTQILTGHGCFRAYLHRSKRADNDNCPYCGEEDTARHTMFECPRWAEERSHIASAIKQNVHENNLVNKMIQSEDLWNVIVKNINKIIGQKEKEEKQIYK